VISCQKLLLGRVRLIQEGDEIYAEMESTPGALLLASGIDVTKYGSGGGCKPT
jgi:hypothetical protein